MANGDTAGTGRWASLVSTATLVAILSGCAPSITTMRPAYSPHPTAGGNDAVVFQTDSVRAAHADQPGIYSLAAADAARNDSRLGVRTPEEALQDRLYRSSEWFAAPTHHPPILLFDHFGGFHGGGSFRSGRGRHSGAFGLGGFYGFPYDPTVPILSPARERSFGYPY